MSYSNNPFLLNPNDPRGNSVQPLNSITQPFPVELQEQERHYFLTALNHSMHRKDGKRLAFVFGHLATKDVYDIDYLEQEILLGNQFLRHATEQEIHIFNSRRDPRGTLAAELRVGIEEEIKQTLELEIRNNLLDKLKDVGITLSPEQARKLLEAMPAEEAASVAELDDALKIAGTGKSGGNEAVKVPGASVLTQPAPSVLGGISGTDKFVAGAKDSNTSSK